MTAFIVVKGKNLVPLEYNLKEKDFHNLLVYKTEKVEYMKAEKHLDKAVITIGGKENRVFEIKVTGYEFPEAEGIYDLNWLNLSFRAKDDKRDDSCTDACMLTWELEQLARELEEFMSSPEEDEYEPDFTENILWLEFKKNPAGGIDMLLEFTSEGKMSATGEWERFRIERTLTQRDLRRAIKVIKISSAAFPQRDNG